MPVVPPGSVAGFTTIAALMTTLYARVPVAPLLSRARIVKLRVPEVVGVPAISPVEALRVSPVPRLPALTLNV